MLLILGDLQVSKKQLITMLSLAENCLQLGKETDSNIIESAIKKADYIFCCNFNLNPYFKILQHIKLIVMAETGIVNIDEHKARKIGLNIKNLSVYSREAVCQYIIYCLLSSVRPWGHFFNNNFDRSRLLSWHSQGLEALNIGVIGYGNIGKRTIQLLRPYGCGIMVNSRHVFRDKSNLFLSKEKIFSKADVVIIACSANETSYGFLNKDLLNRLKKNAVLISISQRSIFKMDDLRQFLTSRSDVQAYLDLEITSEDKTLLDLSQVHFSQHIAFYTEQTLYNRTEQCIQHLQS